MHDSLLVHVLQSAGYLVSVFDDFLLLEVYLILHCLLDDELQVSLLSPLYSNEELVQLAVDEPTEVFDDVWVI